MNNSPLLTQVLSEFEEIFIGDKRELYQKQDFKGFLSDVIEKVERETEKKIMQEIEQGISILYFKYPELKTAMHSVMNQEKQ